MWAIGFVNAWKCAIPSTDFLQFVYSLFTVCLQLFYIFFTICLQLFYSFSIVFPIELSKLLIHYGTSAKVSPSFFSLHFHLCFLMTPLWFHTNIKYIQLPEAESRHRAYLGVSEATLFETVFETQAKYKKNKKTCYF